MRERKERREVMVSTQEKELTEERQTDRPDGIVSDRKGSKGQMDGCEIADDVQRVARNLSRKRKEKRTRVTNRGIEDEEEEEEDEKEAETTLTVA
jgi:hypothetical protein